MISIRPASTLEDLDAARALMRDFIAWHLVRHAEDLDLVYRYFDPAAFETELETLPGKFAPPRGGLFLAIQNDAPAGCVALKEINARDCEMKRMFVRPEFHGLGLGGALAQRVIGEAKEIGYERMLLDTGARQAEAKGLYRSLGFHEIEPYYELPSEVAAWLTFMELPLA